MFPKSDFAIAFYIGSFAVHWYAIFLTIAFMVTYLLSLFRAHYESVPTKPIANFIFAAAPVTLIFARLFYVLGDLGQYSSFGQIFYIWNGGLSIEGGFIGAMIIGYIWFRYYGKKYQTSALKYFEIIVPNVLLGQAIGRWGNFFNQEILGNAIGNNSIWWFLPDFILSHLHTTGELGYPIPGGIVRVPLFLIESFFNFIGFIVLSVVSIFWRKCAKGTTLCGYFLWYGILRVILEPFRMSDYIMYLGDLPLSIFISSIFVAIGLAGIIYVNWSKASGKKIVFQRWRLKILNFQDAELLVTLPEINNSKIKQINLIDEQKGNEKLKSL